MILGKEEGGPGGGPGGGPEGGPEGGRRFRRTDGYFFC